MIENTITDAMWDASPVDVSTEVNFIWSIANKLRGTYQSDKSYFYAQFMRISAHRGKKQAYVAVAHSMLIAIYHILKDGVVFKDLGAD